MSRLRSSPCRGTCQWATKSRRLDGLALFACSGCGSQWVRTEVWTPADCDGQVPAAVRAERAAATAEHDAASAGTPDS